jgi:exodeoxyribonuclease V alpha subunit
VVDECSMADVSLMASLFGVLRPEARLVLAGDKDQLASVEAGVVMADICDTGREHGYAAADAAALQAATGQAVPETMLRDAEPGLSASISVLRRNHRMPDQGGIARVARAVNRGDAEEVLDLVTGGAGVEVQLLPYESTAELHELVTSGTLPWFREYLAADAPERLFQAYGRRAVLCAVRRGPAGVEGVNRAVVSALRRAGAVTSPGVLFPGLPLVVTVNDYSVRLWNGDIGIVAPPRLGGGARCLFARAEGGFRHVSPARLPPHEPAFALTVHKSQGSEFDDVVLVLPSAPTPVASRELLYTALTRARRAVTVLGSPLVLRWMVEHPTVRSSGLRDLLWLP